MVDVKRELKHLKSDTAKAIGWVAAEYSYAKDLVQKLEQISKEKPKEAYQDSRKAFRILRWIGRSERKAERSEEKILKKLRVLGPILPNTLRQTEEKLSKELEVVEGKLVRAASTFTGDLRKELLQIQTEEQLLARLKGEGGERIRLYLENLFAAARAHISEFVRWEKAAEAELRQIKGFEETLERLAA